VADDVGVDPVVIERREARGAAVDDQCVGGIGIADPDVEVHLLRVGGIGPPRPRIVGQPLVEHEGGNVPPIQMEEVVVERGHRVTLLVPRALQDDVGDALRGAALE
jgi:hypothetical protein